MLASLKRSIKLINKDDFDVALFKLVSEEDTNRPKDKHLNVFPLTIAACSGLSEGGKQKSPSARCIHANNGSNPRN
jgi:hypothetical protein